MPAHQVPVESAGSEPRIRLAHLEGFNDQYGHLAGDDRLRAVANAVGRCVRVASPVTARYGSEEFAVVLPAADAFGALHQASFARTAVEALEIPHAKNTDEFGPVTISLGAATALCWDGRPLDRPRVIIAAADTALYRAKRNGRNRTETALLPASPAAVNDAQAAKAVGSIMGNRATRPGGRLFPQQRVLEGTGLLDRR